MNHETTMNNASFQLFETSNTTLPMFYWHLTDSKTMSRDNAQLTVTPHFKYFFS